MEQDSVTLWLRQLSQGNQTAARQLWNRYSQALIRLAQSRFPGAFTAVADEEDLVQSVFQTLWTGAAAGRWDTVKDRSELWWLLLAITRQKAINQHAYNSRQKRGAGHQPLSLTDTITGDSSASPLDQVADERPPPELILMLEEEQQRLLACLRDDVLRSIAMLKLDGASHEQIAQQLDVAPRTVIRKLNLIREKWSKELQP